MADKSNYRWFAFIPRILRFFLPSFATPLEAAGAGLDAVSEKEEQRFEQAEKIGTAAGLEAYRAGKGANHGS